MPNADDPVPAPDGLDRVSGFAGVVAPLECGSSRSHMRGFEFEAQHFSGVRVKGPVSHAARAVPDLLYHGIGAQNVVRAGGGKFGNRAHGPLEVAHVVGVTVAEPVVILVVHAAAGDPPVASREVRGVVQGSKRVLARLSVAGLFEEQGVDCGPARGMVPLARSGAATEAGIGGRLLVDGLRAEERPAAELYPNPIE